MPVRVVEWSLVGAGMLLTFVAAAAQRSVPTLVALAVVGFAAGALATHRSTVAAAAVGTLLFYPVALILEIVLFLGDGWFISAAVSVLVSCTSFVLARHLRSRFTRRST